jgi:hypothetical protein
VHGIDFIPYNIIKQFKSDQIKSKLAITHVRGEIPPHVKPEIDLAVFNKYKTVFAGDLHGRSNSQLNIHYPGSPMVTSFHRSRVSGENGVFILDLDTQDFEWHELNLPQLIRKTISDETDAVPTSPDHTVYELEGNLTQLAGFKSSELIDKKITSGINSMPTLNLSGDLLDEVITYLKDVKGLEFIPEELISLFKEASR